jgi:hypothetical protein
MGYLDDLSKELYAQDDSPDIVAQSREATKMDKSQVQSYGPGSFADYVDFNEFDGGDGQMGVAGDGNTKLEKMDAVPQLAKSKMMSAKNAWGTSTGYADSLLKKNPKMDTSRAQQLENWANQQEVRAKNQQLKALADNFDQQQTSAEENWRQLAKFGVERVQDFDYEEEFGAVAVGDEIEGTISIKTALNRVETHEMSVSDFVCILMELNNIVTLYELHLTFAIFHPMQCSLFSSVIRTWDLLTSVPPSLPVLLVTGVLNQARDL